MKIGKPRLGFTIVELLVVIVVIGILAAVTIVAYNGIQNRAKIAALQSELEQGAKKIEIYKTTNSDTYPSDLGVAGVTTPSGTVFNYQTSSGTYCLSGTSNGKTFMVSNSSQNPTEGACSGVLADGSTCPSGFIVVPANTTLGTNEFCVMKYEAKIAGQSNGAQAYSSAFVPESRADGTPWTTISQINAIDEAATVVGCSGCHLITDAEWMAIAANALTVPSNWSGGSVGSGYVFSGHSDVSPATYLAAGLDSDPYSGTGNSSGQTLVTSGMIGNSQRRTLSLTNGEVIWDLSANVWEWTSSTIGLGQQPGISGESTSSWKQYDNGSLLWNGVPTLSRPSSLATVPGLTGISGWNSAQGIGQLYSNYGSTSSTVRGYIRGGVRGGNANAGIFTLHLNSSTTLADASIGFRVAR